MSSIKQTEKYDRDSRVVEHGKRLADAVHAVRQHAPVVIEELHAVRARLHEVGDEREAHYEGARRAEELSEGENRKMNNKKKVVYSDEEEEL